MSDKPRTESAKSRTELATVTGRLGAFPDDTFQACGLDSAGAVRLASRLSAATGTRLTAAVAEGEARAGDLGRALLAVLRDGVDLVLGGHSGAGPLLPSFAQPHVHGIHWSTSPRSLAKR